MTLAAGFFDGVHLGHREILAAADVALTFDVHPLSVLAPASAPVLLTSLDRRVELLRAAGVADVFVLPFTPALAALSPAAFIALLREKWPRLDGVRCGADWRFGAGGAGGVETLRAAGLRVAVVPGVCVGGERVSSTRIRAALAAADVRAAAALLGRPVVLRGVVQKGKGLGGKLGFPTVNVAVDLDARLLPLGAWRVEAPAPFGRGVANWGVAPTLGAAAWPRPKLEVHFPDAPAAASWPQEGAPFAVRLVSFLRSERRFETLDALRRQLAQDAAQARKEIP